MTGDLAETGQDAVETCVFDLTVTGDLAETGQDAVETCVFEEILSDSVMSKKIQQSNVGLC